MISKTLCALSLLIFAAAPAAAQADDYAQFSRLIADHLPTGNGGPTEVSPLARCATFSPGFECEGEDRDLSDFAAAYSETVGIPVRTREGFADRPPCRWSSRGESQDAGLSLNLGRPAIDADSAEVYAVISCHSERGFRMVQLFWFERGADGTWLFEKTQTVSIT